MPNSDALSQEMRLPCGLIITASRSCQTCDSGSLKGQTCAERWMEPGAEYAQKLPLGKEWYEGLAGGGLGSDHEANASDRGESIRPPWRLPYVRHSKRDCLCATVSQPLLM